VYFDTGKARVARRSWPLLDDVAALLLAHPEIRQVVIEGHTDNQGGRSRNRALSQDRASAVKRYLVNRGVAPSRLTARGFGPDRPAGSNATEAGREANRRVEFTIKGGRTRR
jgi:outer membrane protein OmpA-like peptidoglycan-associated protein